MKKLVGIILFFVLAARCYPAVESAIVHQALRTSTGDQSFTSTGFGDPELAIFIASGNTSLGVANAHARVMYGATDGTDQFVVGTFAYNGGGSSITSAYHDDGHVLAFPGSASINASATFKELTTDGVTITVDVSNATAYLVTCILLKGFQNVDVQTVTLGLQDVETDVNTVGFEPTDVIGVGSNQSALDTVTDHLYYSTGFAHNGGNQYSVSTTYRDAYTYMNEWQEVSSSYIGGYSDPYQTLDYHIELTSFDSSGFSLYPRGGDASGKYYSVISLEHAGDSYVGMGTSKTSTGTKAYTGTGFEPTIVLTHNTSNNATDTISGGVWSEYFSNAVFNGTSEYVTGHGMRNGSGNTYQYQIFDAKVFRTYFHQVAWQDKPQATLDSMDADGFTLDHTSAYSTALYFIYLALDEGPEIATASGGLTGTIF